MVNEIKKGVYICLGYSGPGSCGAEWLFDGQKVIKISPEIGCWEEMSVDFFREHVDLGEIVLKG